MKTMHTFTLPISLIVLWSITCFSQVEQTSDTTDTGYEQRYGIRFGIVHRQAVMGRAFLLRVGFG